MKIFCIIHSLGIGGLERDMAILLPYFVQAGLEGDPVLIGKKRNMIS